MRHIGPDGSARGVPSPIRPDLERVFSVVLRDVVARHPRLTTYRAVGSDGTEVDVTALDDDATEADVRRFLRGASAMLDLSRRPDVVTVHDLRSDVRAITSEPAPAANRSDLPSLRWDQGRELDLLRATCTAVSAIHATRTIHGCLCPSNVFLDAELRPIVGEVGWVSSVRTSPE